MKPRIIWLVGACLAVGAAVCGEPSTAALPSGGRQGLYWVYLARESAASPLALSRRAIDRLAKSGLSPGEDPRDRAVSESSLAPIRERGLEVRRISRWLRAASVRMSAGQARELALDPRVRAVRPVARLIRDRAQASIESVEAPSDRPGGRPSMGGEDPASLRGADYGPAFDQLEMIGATDLHSLGYSGAGVMVALFDGGFYKEHASLSGLDLLAERDFVHDDDETQYDPGDPDDSPYSNDHGTYTWSALGGYAPGKLIGAAYAASFVLAKTEDVSREVHLEEDNYIAALEWADSLGVEIISTSLGYRQFDNGDFYSDGELDGATIPISIAADIAAERGMLVVTAMGNEGPGESSIVAPADGKRVCGVGAVDRLGRVALFSGRGPTGDGRVKPDLCAMGVGTHCAQAASPNVYGRVNGTSLSTPLIAGLAAQLLEARPDWGPDSLLHSLRRTASMSANPTNASGWGIANGLAALGIETARLVVAGFAWQDSVEGNGDGNPNWGEVGQLSLWIRNEGRGASSAGEITPSSHDPRLELLDSLAVALPPVAPGDSTLLALGRAGLTGGPEGSVVRGFVTIEEGDRRIDRRVDLIVVPAELLSAFQASSGPAGTVDLWWSLRTEAVTGVRILREEDGGEPGLIHQGTLLPSVSAWRDHPGRAGEYRYYLDLELLTGQLVIREGPLGVLVEDAQVAALATPFPNPIGSAELAIPFAWPRGGTAEIEIFAVTGRRVARIHGSPEAGGIGLARWDLRDDARNRVAAGLYFVRLEGGPARRVVVLR